MNKLFTHMVIMSTGSEYPCDCPTKENHNYSDKPFSEIISSIQQEERNMLTSSMQERSTNVRAND